MRRLAPAILGVLALWAALGAVRLDAAPALAAPAGSAELARGNELLGQGDFRGAARELERADELAGGRAAEGLIALARAYAGSERYGKAATAARRAVELAPPPDLLRQAYNELGVALIGNHAELAAAEDAFRQSIALGEDRSVPARLNLAEVLRQRKKTAEALATAREILAADPDGPTAKPARILVCQLREGLPPAAADSAQDAADDAAKGAATDEPVHLGLPGDPGTMANATRPVILYRLAPYYTERARRAKLQGNVVLEAVIDREGCVVDAKVLKGLELEIDQVAVETLRRWIFQPATFEGKPIKVYYTMTVNFAIDPGHREP